MPNAPFPVHPDYTPIAIGYRNERLIADDVLPRSPVGKQEFKYLKHAKEDAFTLPDTLVGRKGQVNRVDFSAAEVTDSTNDHGLEDVVPVADKQNAPPGYDPGARATQSLTDLILLDREVRAAALVFNAASYPAGQQVTLSGTSQWSDGVNSDPIGDVMTALDAMFVRANIGVCGRAVFTQLAQHPKVVKAVHGNSGDAGVATRAAIASLFELDALLVGEGWLNTARKGQPASFSRVWGKHFALLHRDPLATPRDRMTFGLTAQWGRREAYSWFDKDVGLRGGDVIRVGESVKELITASDAGYFVQNAVA